MQSIKLELTYKQDMRNLALQINETPVNPAFDSVNNLFGEFQTFSSDLFSQIMNWFTAMLENFLK
jgi:hypothetical protein